MLRKATTKCVLIAVQGARRTTALTRSRREQTRPLAEDEEHQHLDGKTEAQRDDGRLIKVKLCLASTRS